MCALSISILSNVVKIMPTRNSHLQAIPEALVYLVIEWLLDGGSLNSFGKNQLLNYAIMASISKEAVLFLSMRYAPALGFFDYVLT